MEEIWKDIKGYEGLYQVSNLGRVIVLPRFHKNNGRGYMTKGKELRYSDNGHGYITVRLNGRHYYVHRLVAQTFIPNPQCYREINHLDEDKSNNCASNLEWCTHIHNVSYGTKLTRTRETKIKNNSDRRMIETRNRNKCYGAEKPVIGMYENKEILFGSISEAHKRTGVNVSHICMCCKGQRKTAGNIKWKYADVIQ